MKRSMHASFLALLLPLLACDGDDTGEGADTSGATAMEGESTGEPAAVDEEEVVAAAAGYASFELVSAAPYASEHGLAAQVQVWVPADLVDGYVAAAQGTAPDYAPGAMLVKEHLDDDGAHAGLTVMWKGPEGYASEAADWWWGRITKDGTLAEGGQVGYCVACHSGASATGFVFGPPAG